MKNNSCEWNSQKIQAANELKEWLAALKPGDAVGVFDYSGATFRHESAVVKITPTGRIVITGGRTFKDDGFEYGAKTSKWRCIRPLTWK